MIGSRYDRQIRGALAVAFGPPAGAGPVAPANLKRKNPPPPVGTGESGFHTVGVAGFEPTTSSSRTTPPGVLMTLGTLARVSFPAQLYWVGWRAQESRKSTADCLRTETPWWSRPLLIYREREP
jgi:hypothetical protein